jgi:fructose-specific component phosphotransferase system IIB-like protein
MSSYSPELVQTMRAALDEVMTKIPVEQATPGVKAYMAEFILKAAAQGQTNYEDLLNAASAQVQLVLSQLI